MCTSKGCLKDLCSYCILEHQAHINSIRTIESLVEEAAKFYQKFDPAGAQETILSTQNASIREIDSYMTEFLTYFNKKITRLKSDIIAQDKKLLENVVSKEVFLANSKHVSSRRLDIDEQQLSMLQNYLKSDGIQEIPPIKLEIDNFITKFGEIFDDNVKVVKNGVSFETTDPKVPKVSKQFTQILHWFEWNKKKLYIYDILTNNSTIIDLQINFKIPSYSRSVLIPLGHIYLLGGEEPELVTRDDVYMYDCNVGPGNCSLQIRVFSVYEGQDALQEIRLYLLRARRLHLRDLRQRQHERHRGSVRALRLRQGHVGVDCVCKAETVCCLKCQRRWNEENIPVWRPFRHKQ